MGEKRGAAGVCSHGVGLLNRHAASSGQAMPQRAAAKGLPRLVSSSSRGSVPLDAELPARVSAYQVSDVATGHRVILAGFREGQCPRGNALPALEPFQAAAGQAGPISRVRALRRSLPPLQSATTLVDVEAVAKQDYTTSAGSAGDAAIAQICRLRAPNHLQFTRVPAPITGRVGRQFTEGALSFGSAEALKRSPASPIYVDIQQSARFARFAASPLTWRPSYPHGSGTPEASDVPTTDPRRRGIQRGIVAGHRFSHRGPVPKRQSILLPGVRAGAFCPGGGHFGYPRAAESVT